MCRLKFLSVTSTISNILLLLLLLVNHHHVIVIKAQDTAACTDTTDWFDSDQHGCDWYGYTPGNIEGATYSIDDNFNRCEMWGNCCANFGETAQQACCICGGGSYVDTCQDVKIDGKPWVDSTGTTCEWYEMVEVGDDKIYYDDGDTRCSYWGYSQMNNGYTAATACCECGGGFQKGTCNDITEFVDIAGNKCIWYAEDVQGANIPLIDDEGTRCTVFGHTLTAKDPALGEMTANDACCVCGGGKQGIDTQPHPVTTRAPTVNPTPGPKPSTLPSSIPTEVGVTSSTPTKVAIEQTSIPSHQPTLINNFESVKPSTSPTLFSKSEEPTTRPSYKPTHNTGTTETPSFISNTHKPTPFISDNPTASPVIPFPLDTTTLPPTTSSAGRNTCFYVIIASVSSIIMPFLVLFI